MKQKARVSRVDRVCGQLMISPDNPIKCESMVGSI